MLRKVNEELYWNFNCITCVYVYLFEIFHCPNWCKLNRIVCLNNEGKSLFVFHIWLLKGKPGDERMTVKLWKDEKMSVPSLESNCGLALPQLASWKGGLMIILIWWFLFLRWIAVIKKLYLSG